MLLDYLDRAAKFVGFGDDAVTNLYTDSFLETVVDTGVDVYNRVDDFLESPTGQTARTLAMKQLGKGAQTQMPRGARISAPTGGSTLAQYSASQADLGFTANVQNMARNAYNAKAGSAVGQTVQRLSTRPAKGANIPLETAQVRVAPRSRGVS